MSKNKCVNIEVRLEKGDSTDRLIKKFFKKCKKQDIVREYIDKTSYYMTRTQKKRAKILKNKHEKNRKSKY